MARSGVSSGGPNPSDSGWGGAPGLMSRSVSRGRGEAAAAGASRFGGRQLEGGMWNGMGMLRHCRQLLASRRSRSGVVENKLQKLPHRPLPSRHVAACGGSWA
jgi:hypothetical protein